MTPTIVNNLRLVRMFPDAKLLGRYVWAWKVYDVMPTTGVNREHTVESGHGFGRSRQKRKAQRIIDERYTS